MCTGLFSIGRTTNTTNALFASREREREREREIFDEKDDRVVYSSNKINASPFLPFDFEEVEGLLKKPGQKWRINVRVQKGFTSRGF